jgi:hypothetical protein
MHRNFQFISYGLAVLMLALSVSMPQALADKSPLSISGFATMAFAQAIDDDSKQGSDGLDYFGLNEVDEDGEYRDFNKLGLRLSADLGHNLLLGAQLIANGEDDYEAEFDWLYAQYDFTPNVSIKVGRTTAPLYMYSDYLDTSYAYQWIEAPYAVYGAGNIKTNEGFMLDWKASMGHGWTSLLTLFAGEVDERVPELDDNIQIQNGVGLAWNVENEWLRLRVVHYSGKSTVESVGVLFAQQINQGFNDYANGIEALGDTVTAAIIRNDIANNPYDDSFQSYHDMAWDDSDASYIGFGLGLDFEYVFFNAEATRVEIEDTAGAGPLDSWYAMLGWRLNNTLSLAFTYSESDDETADYDYDKLRGELAQSYNSDDSAVNARYSEAISALSTGIDNTLASTRFEDTATYSLSGRWDFHTFASLKLEYLIEDRNRLDANEIDINNKSSAYRAGIDLVF